MSGVSDFVPSVGVSSLFVLVDFEVIVSVLSYYILFCFLGLGNLLLCWLFVL